MKKYLKNILEDEIVLYTRKSKNHNLVPRKVPKPDCLNNLSRQPDEKVFNNGNDKPKFIYKKVNWSWHNLRHRYASILSKNNIPLFEIMSLLGHSSLETTQRYLQLLP